MIHDLLINSAILISFVSISSQIFREHGLNENSPLRCRLLHGGINGLLGILLMLDSLHILPNLIIDFRNLAIIMAAVYGGWTSVLAAGSMIAGFRIMYFGVNIYSVSGLAAALLMSAGCYLICKFEKSKSKRWVCCVIYTLLINGMIITFLLKDTALSLEIISSLSVGTIVLSFVLYKYIKYLGVSNNIYRRLREEATKDFLTGLNNVRRFDSVFNTAMKKAIVENKNLTMLFIDIDFFKKVNDSYGHLEGDYVLKELGEILSENCRSRDVVSRMGGEEFSILLYDCSMEKSMEIAERIRLAVEYHKFRLSNGEKIGITISIGAAVYPDATPDPSRLIEYADAALYNAKYSGRNRVCISKRCMGDE